MQITCFREIIFMRKNLFFEFNKSTLSIKTESGIATVVLFWFFLTTFGKIIWKSWFVEPWNKHGFQNDTFTSVSFLKKKENICIFVNKTKHFNFILLDLLINRFLYHWNNLPNFEKKYIMLNNENQDISIYVSNIKVDDILQPMLAQIQNTFLNSFTFIFKFSFTSQYSHFYYFFLSFFKVI